MKMICSEIAFGILCSVFYLFVNFFRLFIEIEHCNPNYSAFFSDLSECRVSYPSYMSVVMI